MSLYAAVWRYQNTLNGNRDRGLSIEGANTSFRKTGGTIYGNDAGANSNTKGAIMIELGKTKNQYIRSNAEGSKVYAATINAGGNGVVADSLEGDDWEE